MSDWTSGFSGFREGMGLLQQGRARRADQKLQERQLSQDDRRMQTYEAESKARQAMIDEQLRDLRQRLTAPQVPPAPGARPKEYDAAGRVTAWAPAPEDPRVVDVGGQRVLVHGERVQPLDPDYSQIFEKVMGGGVSVQPPAVNASGGGLAPGGGVRAPTAEASQTPSSGGRYRISRFTPGQAPTLEWVPDVQEPQVVEMDTPAGKQMFIRSVGADGRPNLSPYNPPQDSGKITDKQVTLGNLKTARDTIRNLRQAMQNAGNVPNVWNDAPDKATLLQAPLLLGVAMAKILDPGSVAREGEVAAAQKYLIPMGWGTQTGTTQAALDQLEKMLSTKEAELGLLKDDRGRGPDSPPAPGDGPPKVASKAEYDALPSGSVYVDDSGTPKRKP